MEGNAVYDIATLKNKTAVIYYKDPKKPVSVDSIIQCLKEALETYEKIGHVRGTAAVLGIVGNIYRDGNDFKSAIDTYQKAAAICSSINESSAEATLNSKIGFCHSKLEDLPNAKLYFDKCISYFEKNLSSEGCKFEDKLSLVESYLLVGNYDKAFNLSNELMIIESAKDVKSARYLAPLLLALSSVLSNAEEKIYNCFKQIEEFDCKKLTLDWDFAIIESIINKTGEFKGVFTDAITFLKGEINYLIIRLKDVKILNEEKGKQAEVFHPFLDVQTITRDDKDLQEIMQKLKNTVEVDFDVPEIMGIPRNKALYILGFLFKKGFLDCENLENQKFDLKLTERGLRVWEMRGSS